ncbi:probable O-methyltransferase 3 [Vigna unguiculata]|uniref:probable O-methyltransferase 3 n=1 Tax=Vigna unguiculata TaxID=3917 RepID=UPI001016B83A|nr:probable O-methyltransferase 3 [Vigna unguiculata]
METQGGNNASQLLRAQTHVWNHILKFINSLSLKCATELGIADIIHNYGQPMPLSQLIASLPIHPSKTSFISRFMRILTHSGFFSEHHDTPNEGEVMYVLTDASKLLLKDHPSSMKSLLQLIVDPVSINPWFQFSTENIEYVGGDMFQAIPSADSIMLKLIMHNWKDEECVKILKNCKESIASEGRVIIIDMVMENKKEDHELTEMQLFLDMQMMMLFSAKERNEKEWANLIFSAGFSNYNITPIGLFSIIEVYP